MRTAAVFLEVFFERSVHEAIVFVKCLFLQQLADAVPGRYDMVSSGNDVLTRSM
jgi:hypothetical protein